MNKTLEQEINELKEKVAALEVQVQKLPSKNQVADIVIKILKAPFECEEENGKGAATLEVPVQEQQRNEIVKYIENDLLKDYSLEEAMKIMKIVENILNKTQKCGFTDGQTMDTILYAERWVLHKKG